MAQNRWNQANNWGYPGAAPQQEPTQPDQAAVPSSRPLGAKFIKTMVLAAFCAVSGRIALEFWPMLQAELTRSLGSSNANPAELYGSLPAPQPVLWNCGGNFRSTPQGGEACRPVETKLAAAKR